MQSESLLAGGKYIIMVLEKYYDAIVAILVGVYQPASYLKTMDEEVQRVQQFDTSRLTHSSVCGPWCGH